MDLAAELGRLERIPDSLTLGAEYQRLQPLGDLHRLGWTATTLGAVSVDLADKLGTFDAAERAFVGAP